MVKIKFLFAMIMLGCISIKGQDLNFSQFYELPLLRNPALAFTSKGDIRVSAAFRNQWASVTTPFRSEALGAEMKFPFPKNSDNYASVGLQITNDQAGDSKMGKTQFLPLFAYHKSMSEDKDAYLSIGFMGGPVQQRFDNSKLKFDDQFVNGVYSDANPTTETLVSSNLTYWDFSGGIVYSSVFANDIKYYAGVSLFHVNKPKVNFGSIISMADGIRLPMKAMVSVGLSAPTSEFDRLTLYSDYFMQGGNRQMQGGVIYKHDVIRDGNDESMFISVGSLLRWNDAIIPVLKLDIYRLGIGFTYDVNISKLRAASQLRGGFEATMSYTVNLNMHKSTNGSTHCPVTF